MPTSVLWRTEVGRWYVRHATIMLCALLVLAAVFVAVGLERGARGVAYGLAVGVGIGIAVALLRGAVAGVAFGPAVGAAMGVAGAVTGGLAGGAVGSVAVAVAYAAAIGVGFGVSGGVAGAVIYAVSLGLAAGWAVGIAAGVAAFGLFGLPVRWAVAVIARHASASSGAHPIWWCDLDYLPYPGMEDLVVRVAQEDPQRGARLLERCAINPGQRGAAQRARLRIQIAEARRMAARGDWAQLACLDGPFLPGTADAPETLRGAELVARAMLAVAASDSTLDRLDKLRAAERIANQETNRWLAPATKAERDAVELARALRDIVTAQRMALQDSVERVEESVSDA